MCERMWERRDRRDAKVPPHYAAKYRIRPHCSQLTISFPALTPAAVAVVTFMWQPVQTPCSTATIAASPLLLKRRSNWSSKSASILDASASRSFSSSRCCVSSVFDLLSRSTNCREIVSLVARAAVRSEEHTSELQSPDQLVSCLRL